MSELAELYSEIAGCRSCGLAQTRRRVVPGEGAENAEIMFIGEAPGWHEDQQGRPFVGPAGKLLEELLTSIGLKRSDVYIANVIKCRPPNNRDPLPSEIEACSSFLERQIELIRPRVIVTLGRYSMSKYFPGETISKVHGTSRKIGETICFAMYHPAAALHQPALRQVLEADVLKIPRILAHASQFERVEHQPEPRQLNLF
ncbi:MAG: uracil-DNA glycosylase family protein [Chloroflexota bacterium]